MPPKNPPPPVPSIIPNPKPEDPGSPELQRLAMILREAEKMVGRLEKGVDGLKKQNVGGAVEGLVINNPPVEKVGKTKEKEPVSNPVNRNYGGGGGGGATSSTPSPISSPQISSSSSQTPSTQTTSTTTLVATTINPPTITSPANFSQFTTATIDFSGTASSTQIISSNFSNATTTTNQNNDWDLTLSNFSQGTTTIEFFASENQNISSSTAIEIFVDAVAPGSPSLEIAQCNNSITTNSCLITSTTLDILWATTTASADFSHFNLDDNGIFSITTATTTQITNLTDGETYTVSVATVDINGNASATTTKTVIINQMPIVINEIAWAGTEASSADEWIELYNRSNEDIDMSDWVIYSQDLVPYLELQGTINAGAYYLIERTDDNTISDIGADLVTAFSGLTSGAGLGNGGEHLILAYQKPNQATTTVDEVPFGSGWPTGDGYRTLEKYNPNLSGTDTDNWALSVRYSASYDLINGLDADGNKILGTPKARNSINYKIVKGNILTEDKIITKANSPYYVGADGLTIQIGKTLTIEEGVIIKTIDRHDNAEIVVKGSIQANGSTTEPIIFTLFSDDVGGDTNGDGDCNDAGNVCPGLGNNFWSQVVFLSDSENSYFNNTIFRYGGSRLYTTYPRGMVVVDNTDVDFINTTFEQSYTNGLYLTSATSTVENCIFKDGKKVESYNDPTYYGLFALNGGIIVRNSTFDNNQVGLGLFDTIGAVVDSNVFRNHSNLSSSYSDFPLIMSGSSGFTLVNNSGINNYKNAISVRGYTARDGSDTVLVKNPLPYLIERNIYTTASSTLTIGPGIVFKFNDNGPNRGNLSIEGRLIVNGGSGLGEGVLFTSAFDDSDGTDMYNDGVTTGVVTHNQKINLQSATTVIKNAEFRFLERALSFTNSDPVDLNLENVKFENNTWSIYADNQNAQVTLADNLVFATTTLQSMNSAVKSALQSAKDNGANIIW